MVFMPRKTNCGRSAEKKVFFCGRSGGKSNTVLFTRNEGGRTVVYSPVFPNRRFPARTRLPAETVFVYLQSAIHRIRRRETIIFVHRFDFAPIGKQRRSVRTLRVAKILVLHEGVGQIFWLFHVGTGDSYFPLPRDARLRGIIFSVFPREGKALYVSPI